MKQSLQLKVSQQLTLTPQLQQAIKLLQLSSIDLQQEIQETLYSNPMLEVSEETAAEPTADSEAEKKAPEPEQAAKLDEWNNEIPGELSVDANWDDIYQPSNFSSRTTSKPSSGGEQVDFEAFHAVTESLQDHLLWQLNLTPMSDLDRAVAKALIDAIDDDGMLTEPPEDILENSNIEELDLEEVYAVLHRIQQFDPPGVGAQTIAECLSIQLNQISPDTPHLACARILVTDYLSELAAQNYRKIHQRTGFDETAIRNAVKLIQNLNPRPGEAISNSNVEYVVPDARVYKTEQGWQVALNQDVTPQLSINRLYADMVRSADSSKDNLFLKENLQEAKWFLRSLESRNDTLMRVSVAIVEKQQAFLDSGPEAMKPMVLADIAEKLDLHESTISRVTTQKYLDTPQGIFELKYFFSSHVSTSSGGECSSTAIRAMLKKLIDNEPNNKPLSDNKLMSLLQEQGIEIARRTVAKYREGMGIPSSSERKRFKQYQ